MRLWSLHPKYLDAKGLVALWREALLARKVLMGETRGYRNHSQLVRLRETGRPLSAISFYLDHVCAEAVRRGYNFDSTKLMLHNPPEGPVPVTTGQVAFEREHLAAKLAKRDPARLAELPEVPDVHSLFTVVPGPVEGWERGWKEKEVKA